MTTVPQGRLLGPGGALLPEGIGRAISALATRDVADFGGRRAGSLRGQDLAGWVPRTTSADGSWLGARNLAVARTRDLYAEDPLAQSIVDRKVALLVGDGWRPSIKPDGETLGISPAAAMALGREIERCWRLWAEDPLCRGDTEETQTFGWQLHVMAVESIVAGDALAVLRWEDRDDGFGFRTSLQLVDADRLSNPSMQPARPGLKGGVETDARGRPVAFHIRNGHPGEYGLGISANAWVWERVARRTPWGRPQVLHHMRKDRPGQTRGISKLTAGLAKFKNLDRLAEAELRSSIINALVAATIESSFDPTTMQDQLTEPAIKGLYDLRNDFYDIAEPTLAGSKIQHLYLGDQLKMNGTPRQSANFGTFNQTFYNVLGASVGMTRHMVTMDWSDSNYSSMRGELLEVWRGVNEERSLLRMTTATPLLLAVTEDAIDQGILAVPAGCADLYDAPAAWLRGNWIGPARGWVDQVKEPAGALLRIEAGLSDWETEAAEQGQDFEMTVTRLKEQRVMWEAAGLIPPALAAMQAATDRLAVGGKDESPVEQSKAV